ncbi:hypothetical protein KUTeg_020241 [Tegillarca granosa]|uniref:Uncharacterized protein n=1 Tax=Tegillarca granosa TaxID=220873 RepID=A0ABQ9E7C6_TEGGR|nr:hypothetical protein KUTeg_020241 [Tegillarca granosa]
MVLGEISQVSDLKKVNLFSVRNFSNDSSRPEVDTTKPEVDTTKPEVDTTKPEVDTTKLEVNTTSPVPPPSNSGIIAAVVIIVLLLAAVLVAYFVHKYIIIRRHKVVYRYSLLQQDDGKDNAYENALAAKPIVYEDSSDDEELNSPAVPRNATNGNPFKQPKVPVKSYHDDSDVVRYAELM